MNYYPFHIGDYLSATRHLSWEEDAAYRRLLDSYYTSEKPLPLDLKKVCRLVLATTESQREAVQTVLDEFFEKTEDGWINHRADNEIAAMQEKQQKQREKANKMWAARKAAEHITESGIAPAMPQLANLYAVASKTDANAMPPTPTPTPTPTPININTPPTPKGGCERFEDFWKAWPTTDRKQAKGKCLDTWKKAHAERDAAVILAHVEHLKESQSWQKNGGEFIPAPLVYLNGRRWEGACVESDHSAMMAGAI